MTAYEVIKRSAALLNIKEILEDRSLDDLTESNNSTILSNNFTLNRMFEILKIMLNDLANDYIPIVKEVELNSENKKISLSNLENLNKIMQVKYNGAGVKYSISNDCINFDFDGTFKIKYSVSPNIDNLTDSVNVFGGRISEDLLIYGLTSFYCLVVGLFDEFNIYNQIYNDKLSAINNLKIIEMPCRRWE